MKLKYSVSDFACSILIISSLGKNAATTLSLSVDIVTLLLI